MFLEQTMKRNRPLVEAAIELEKAGQILPDSYVVDVDTFVSNAKKILDEAKKYDFQLYFMLKQLGRNPYLAEKLMEAGYSGAVAVDFKEAQVMMNHHIPIENVGHLVQIPAAMIESVVAYGPKSMTVYSVEKIRQIEKAAKRLEKTQGIIIRVYSEEDLIYSGQTAGFSLKQLPTVAKIVQEQCPHMQINGITSFPCYLYDEAADDVLPTKNLETVLRAKKILEDLGYEELIINTPSATCVKTLDLMHQYGGNCGEPGHGLTGTTPLHAQHEEPELPAVVYVSEVSHNFMGKAYCYGGGHYRRSHVAQALVGSDIDMKKILEVTPPSDECIDYHFGLSEECAVGEPVVMAFRFQIFVTRSDVVLVEGIQSGNIRIAGIYDSMGRKKD